MKTSPLQLLKKVLTDLTVVASNLLNTPDFITLIFTVHCHQETIPIAIHLMLSTAPPTWLARSASSWNGHISLSCLPPSLQQSTSQTVQLSLIIQNLVRLVPTCFSFLASNFLVHPHSHPQSAPHQPPLHCLCQSSPPFSSFILVIHSFFLSFQH